MEDRAPHRHTTILVCKKKVSVQHRNEPRRSSVIYDMGNGARLIGAIVFAAFVFISVTLIAANSRELKELPSYAVRNPIEGLVLLVGGALTLWCIAFGIWVPLRTAIFPRKNEGPFAGLGIIEDPNGKRSIEINVADTKVRTRYNPLLAKALNSVSQGSTIRMFVGPRGLVARIEVIEAKS